MMPLLEVEVATAILEEVEEDDGAATVASLSPGRGAGDAVNRP